VGKINAHAYDCSHAISALVTGRQDNPPISNSMATNEEERMSVATVPRLYRASEVARLLGVTPERVRELVTAGELRSIRLGGQGWHRFRAEDVERLIAGNEQSP
jgi:excisionase family DNA binding protein